MTKRKCSATTRSGRPCRQWATLDSDPPLCPAHDKPPWLAPGGEARDDAVAGKPPAAQAPAEVMAMIDAALIGDELALNRVILRRLLEATEGDELAMRELVRVGRLVFRGGQAVARLLRKEEALSGQAADDVAGAIGKALDELGTEWGLEL
jgi:hypothetical protein